MRTCLTPYLRRRHTPTWWPHSYLSYTASRAEDQVSQASAPPPHLSTGDRLAALLVAPVPTVVLAVTLERREQVLLRPTFHTG